MNGKIRPVANNVNLEGDWHIDGDEWLVNPSMMIINHAPSNGLCEV